MDFVNLEELVDNIWNDGNATEVHDISNEQNVNNKLKIEDKETDEQMYNLAKSIAPVFTCNYCDYKSTDKMEAWTHQKQHHHSEKPIEEKYSCPKCNHCTVYKINVEKHIKIKHLGVRFPCNECDGRFTTPHVLKLHIDTIHRKIKYPCDRCDYKAKSPSALYIHKKKATHPILERNCNYYVNKIKL